MRKRLALLNLRIIAEGVEDQATIDSLKAMGCDMVQGYYYSEAKDWAGIESWLLHRRDNNIQRLSFLVS